jgi:hypothetical protein
MPDYPTFEHEPPPPHFLTRAPPLLTYRHPHPMRAVSPARSGFLGARKKKKSQQSRLGSFAMSRFQSDEPHHREKKKNDTRTRARDPSWVWRKNRLSQSQVPRSILRAKNGTPLPRATEFGPNAHKKKKKITHTPRGGVKNPSPVTSASSYFQRFSPRFAMSVGGGVFSGAAFSGDIVAFLPFFSPTRPMLSGDERGEYNVAAQKSRRPSDCGRESNPANVSPGSWPWLTDRFAFGGCVTLCAPTSTSLSWRPRGLPVT